MAKLYRIEAVEVHHVNYIVEAEDEAEALRNFYSGENSEVCIEGDTYPEIDNLRGASTDFFPNLTDSFNERYASSLMAYTKIGDYIPGVNNIQEESNEQEEE